jgi:hypothetical protein
MKHAVRLAPAALEATVARPPEPVVAARAEFDHEVDIDPVGQGDGPAKGDDLTVGFRIRGRRSGRGC